MEQHYRAIVSGVMGLMLSLACVCHAAPSPTPLAILAGLLDQADRTLTVAQRENAA